MKYRCCSCNAEFHLEDAVDGYDVGYKSGFLCPECGVNISSDRIADILAEEKLKGRRLFTFTLGLYVLGHFFGVANLQP